MFSYLFTRLFIESFRLVPFWLLYIQSDIFRFIMFDIFQYRKKIIFDNLTRAFPEKSDKEIKQIARKFYKNFMDILLEGFKGQTMSDKSVYKRYKFINPEFADAYFDQGKSLLVVAGHYASWEWGVSIDKHMKHDSVCVYKAVKNKRLNEFIRRNRERWGMKQISMEKTRTIFKNLEKPKFIILVADQSPGDLPRAIWVNFLGRLTPCIHGPEAYSKIFNFPLVFLDFQRIRRGHYSCEVSLLNENPKSLKNEEVTQLYMSKMEEVIRKKPEDWMWTHKRWKHKKVGDKVIRDYYYKKKTKPQ